MHPIVLNASISFIRCTTSTRFPRRRATAPTIGSP